jgi:hypothetical protein
VLGSGLKYEGVGTIPPEQAQLIEQLKWTVEDVARCFGMPLFKIGGPVPPGSSIEALNLGYYTDCLQSLIESAELCLDEGLELPSSYHTEFDLDGLLRMDQGAQYDAMEKGVRGMWLAPNDARRKMDLPPVDGGESPLAAAAEFLARRVGEARCAAESVRDRSTWTANPTPSYEAAVAAGFVGSEQQWLVTLRGPQGLEGERGPQGEPGARGEPGLKGDSGERGEQGPPGADGAKGDTGAAGEPGSPGEAGAKGDPGEAGARGEAGEQGPRGEPGPAGENWRDRATRRSGRAWPARRARRGRTSRRSRTCRSRWC